jgi:hypothetical protein
VGLCRDVSKKEEGAMCYHYPLERRKKMKKLKVEVAA